MLEKDLTIVNRRGLHARASAKLVKLVETFDADVQVSKDGQTVGGTSIMGLMMLAAGKGTELKAIASGSDAESALEELAKLFARKFDEK